MSDPILQNGGDMEKKIPTFTMAEVAAMTKDELAWATEDRTPCPPEEPMRLRCFAIVSGRRYPLEEHTAPRVSFSASGRVLR